MQSDSSGQSTLRPTQDASTVVFSNEYSDSQWFSNEVYRYRFLLPPHYYVQLDPTREYGLLYVTNYDPLHVLEDSPKGDLPAGAVKLDIQAFTPQEVAGTHLVDSEGLGTSAQELPSLTGDSARQGRLWSKESKAQTTMLAHLYLKTHILVVGAIARHPADPGFAEKLIRSIRADHARE